MHENKIFSGGGFNKEKFCDMLNPESVLSKFFGKRTIAEWLRTMN